MTLLGARDLDPLEQEALSRSAIRRGGEIVAPPGSPLYFHLDLDVLDPAEARVNSYAAPGGPSVRDVRDVIGSVRPDAAAITAYDPALEEDGRTCDVAVQLALALVEARSR